MPAQYFSVDDGSAPIVTVHWDMGYRPIEVSFRGELVTRLDDDVAVRSTGLQGPAPDGTVLVVRLGPSPSGETFTVERDGQQLHGSPVDYTAIRPRTWASPMGASAVPGFPTTATTLAGMTLAPDDPVVAKKIKTARSWMRGLGILSLFGAAFLFLAASSTDTLNANGTATVDASSVRTLAIVAAVVGLVRIGLASMAKGARTTTILAVAFVIEALNLLTSLVGLAKGGGSIIVGLVVAGVGTWKVFEGWQASKRVRPVGS